MGGSVNLALSGSSKENDKSDWIVVSSATPSNTVACCRWKLGTRIARAVGPGSICESLAHNAVAVRKSKMPSRTLIVWVPDLCRLRTRFQLKLRTILDALELRRDSPHLCKSHGHGLT